MYCLTRQLQSMYCFFTGWIHSTTKHVWRLGSGWPLYSSSWLSYKRLSPFRSCSSYYFCEGVIGGAAHRSVVAERTIYWIGNFHPIEHILIHRIRRLSVPPLVVLFHRSRRVSGLRAEPCVVCTRICLTCLVSDSACSCVLVFPSFLVYSSPPFVCETRVADPYPGLGLLGPFLRFFSRKQ